MYIELYYNDETIKRYYLPDFYLKDLPWQTKRQNFEAREKIINAHVAKIRHECSKMMGSRNITIGLCFESKGFDEQAIINKYKKRCNMPQVYLVQKLKLQMMKNIPKKIYLQIGEGSEDKPDFSAFSEVTWSVDKVFNNDIEFVLNKPDVLRCASEIVDRLTKAEQQYAECKQWVDDAYKRYNYDRRFFGAADNGEYLTASSELSLLNTEIQVLKWVMQSEA